MNDSRPHISVHNLSIGFGSHIILRDLSFEVRRGDIFVIMGGSGSGKSTLMRYMIGLNKPFSGQVFYDGVDIRDNSTSDTGSLIHRIGVMYQGGALWSSMTLGENIGLPLREFTRLSRSRIKETVDFKLSLVGLAGYEDYYPAELSGGMQKRAALARAIALDPDIIYFDEPAAGLDPVTSRRLDQLIAELSRSLNATVVIVTHELSSIFAIGNNSIFLDPESKTIIARGHPRELREQSDNEKVSAFLKPGGV